MGFEKITAIICLAAGILLQYRARKAGAVDMQILGAMLWIAGAVLLMDAHWHFLTEPEH